MPPTIPFIFLSLSSIPSISHYFSASSLKKSSSIVARIPIEAVTARINWEAASLMNVTIEEHLTS
jgi:hypothetical protein